jgi:UDP-2,3-diacylglucosamine pyrophosphatase LpxH
MPLQYVTSYLLELPTSRLYTISPHITHQHKVLLTTGDLFDPWKSQLVHFYSKLEQVVQTLTLSLGLGDIVSPDIAAGTTH